ncbi:MAG: mannitol dehydrogenase family protein [Acidimicrobiia bacterium]
MATPRLSLPLHQKALPSLDSLVPVPKYERDGLLRSIVHIGVGGFHRAHLATYIHELCNAGLRSWAIVGSGVLPHDQRMAEVLASQDGLYSLIVRSAAATTVSVIGSLVDYIHASPTTSGLIRQIAEPGTRLVSLTLTEGGYPVDEKTRIYDPKVAPAGPGSAFGILVSALELRMRNGSGPVTVISCDNVVGNGDVARAATLGVAEDRDPLLRNWIEESVPFPNSMVDRITPATTDADRTWLEKEYGIVDGWPVVTEPFRQWVIEDQFAAERPPWEDVGVMVTSDVEPYELMKLRMLNAGHSTMAYLAALAGIEKVHTAMSEPGINRFLLRFLEREAGPVLPKVPGIDVPTYQASLIERFSNPTIGDQIARLCLDGSAKFPKFLLPTVRAQLAVGGPVELSALALAGWCQYLNGTADDGSKISHSSDPDLPTARAYAAGALTEPASFLQYRSVFGDDLRADRRFVDAFTRALASLRTKGVLLTLDSAVGASEANPR